MIRNDILKAEPGRELDLEVAAKVFGDITKTKAFSTDIAAAWEIVENPKFYSFSIQKCTRGEFYEAYCVIEAYRAIDKNAVNIDGRAIAEKSPEAICKAALLAMMGVAS